MRLSGKREAAASGSSGVVDAVLAVAMTAALQLEIWAPDLLGGDAVHGHRLWLSVTSLAISLPLLWRRRYPWAAALTAFGAAVLQARVATPPDGLASLTALLVVAYSLGRWSTRPAAYSVSLIAVTAGATGSDLADVAFIALVLTLAWVFGYVVTRSMRDLGRLELKRMEATRRGAEEERLRIARELHDVVAHRVSMIVVQSQLADTVLDADPEAAHRAVRAVEQSAREALDELRSVLGVLHEDSDGSRGPQDTDLARLGDLVTAARSGGLPATLTVTGTERAVPPAVALAVFRIVQESLTNVAKHADRAAARVLLAYRAHDVVVDVENDGDSVGPHAPGHGLAGMHERASFVGGTLEAEARPTGGFRVRAVLPTPGLPA